MYEADALGGVAPNPAFMAGGGRAVSSTDRRAINFDESFPMSPPMLWNVDVRFASTVAIRERAAFVPKGSRAVVQ